MERMKKFLLYFVMFIGLFLFVEFFTNIGMKEKNEDITNYVIKTTSPKIEVTECKASYANGYIKGNITNDTKEHIQKIYLKIDLYNSNGIYLGTESKEIKYFNVKETINFDITFKYKNVKKIEIELVNETKQNIADNEKNNQDNDVFSPIKPEITEETIKIAIPIAAVMTGIYACNAFGL